MLTDVLRYLPIKHHPIKQMVFKYTYKTFFFNVMQTPVYYFSFQNMSDFWTAVLVR